ncbi:MAG: glycosyltransferase family 9 protein [Bacteroidia bacterium]|nr:glycosyltransferase family 9 protein [Bacteroidia bacterium]
MPKFLVIRFSSIGDIILTSPVVRCLKQQVKDAEVHFLTKKSFYPVIEHNPFIDKKIAFEEGYRSLISELKKEKYDTVIDLHHNLRTCIIKRALGVKSFSFHKENFNKWKMVNLKQRMTLPHVVERYLQTVSHFGVINDGKGLDYFLPDELNVTDPFSKKKLPKHFQSGYLAVVVGARHVTKQPPVAMLSSLIKNRNAVLLGGKEDFQRAEQIRQNENQINLCGKLSLHESAWLIKHSQKVVTPDTGLMHIAAAFGKEIISLWGNTVPGFGMTPYFGNKQGKSKIFEVELPCRPCSKIGFKDCPKKHFDCMNKQDAAAIGKAIES